MSRSRFLALTVLISAIAAVPPAAADEGGSMPLEPAPSLPLSVSDTTPAWGAPVKVSGRVARSSAGKVTLWLAAPGIGRQVLARARPDRSGGWKATIRTFRSGTLTASQGGTVFGASLGGGSRLAVHPAASIPASLPLSRTGTTRLAASVRPGGRWAWTARLRRGAGAVALKSGVTGRDGIIRASFPARRRDVVEIVIRGQAGFAASSHRSTVARLRPALASWYGLYGSGLACGGVLGRNQIGVAHKTLPCGTRVTISYRGRTIVAPVVDRGPYIAGREFDLTGAAARALGFDGVGRIWVSP